MIKSNFNSMGIVNKVKHLKSEKSYIKNKKSQPIPFVKVELGENSKIYFSIAKHLLEGRTDLKYIQEIWGHKSSKTTDIYAPVSDKDIGRIKSPIRYAGDVRWERKFIQKIGPGLAGEVYIRTYFGYERVICHFKKEVIR